MTPIPGVEEPVLEALATLLSPLGCEYRLSLFGSRARGTWKPASDIDLLVEGQGPIPLKLLAQIETGLAESSLPLKVDLVDARRASPAFLDSIAPDLRSLS
jgi:type I restriction enzyme S subunit